MSAIHVINDGLRDLVDGTTIAGDISAILDMCD